MNDRKNKKINKITIHTMKENYLSGNRHYRRDCADGSFTVYYVVGNVQDQDGNNFIQAVSYLPALDECTVLIPVATFRSMKLCTIDGKLERDIFMEKAKKYFENT